MYGAMRRELRKLADLSGLGRHISRSMRASGGAQNVMMLGLQDDVTQGFTEGLTDLVNQGRFGQARQAVALAGFPDNIRARLVSTIDRIKSNPVLPANYRASMILQALDVP